MKYPFIPPRTTNVLIPCESGREGAPEKLRYNPDRDLGYVGPVLVRAVLVFMDKVYDENKITPEMYTVVNALATIFKRARESEPDKTDAEFYEELLECPEEALREVMANIGLAVVASTVNAVRDVALPDERHLQVEDLYRAGQEILERWSEKLKCKESDSSNSGGK